MKFVAKADAGQWIKATNEYERIIAKASTLAMRDVGKIAENDGRAAIAAGGFSTKFQRTLQAVNKPQSGYVLNPAVWLHSTINYSDIFETGRTISGSPFLWLPLPSVPPFSGRPHMTPKQYVRNVGPLVTMRRPGKLPMLGAVIKRGSRAQPFGTFATRAQLRRGRSRARGSTETIPLFVGVPLVSIPKKFDVKGAVEKSVQDMPRLYLTHLEAYEGRR